jgi:FHA domain-containing protein
LGEVIWVEVLSRHRDVVARYRCQAAEISIGRGYDNDVLIDDPYVASRHLRILRDASGALIAIDPGSANGLFADHGDERFERIVLDGERPIRIGRTYLRIREAQHAVPPQRVTIRPTRAWLAILALGATILGLNSVLLWLGETTEPKASHYILPLLVLTMVALLWTAAWAILSRIFSRRARFERHLLIALTVLFAFSLLNELVDYSAFALAWRVPEIYQYIGAWLFFAVLCFLHLRAIGPSRLKLKAGVVAGLAVIAISAQILEQSENRPFEGYNNYVRNLKPPALRLASPQSERAFFADVEMLKAPLDQARTEDPTAGGMSALFDIER